MVLPQTYIAVLSLTILSMLCLGCWANTLKMVGKWRFELFYFDYALGAMLAATLYAFTVGTLGFDGFSFLDDLLHAGKRQVAYGLAAGTIFNLANMLLVAAISVAGLAVAFPVGMGMALVTGVVWSYAARPSGNPILLFAGCAMIAGAVIVDSLAYRALSVLKLEKLAKAGRSKTTMKKVSPKALILSLAGGLLMGSFFPLIELGTAGEVGLGPYAISWVFALGVFFSTLVFNLFFMNLPVEGEPVEVLEYLDGSLRQHSLGLLGGAVWFTGIVASFVAAGAPEEMRASPALGYAAGQGATIIAALCGLSLWKEFGDADSRVKAYAMIMLALFAVGLAMVSLSPLFAAR